MDERVYEYDVKLAVAIKIKAIDYEQAIRKAEEAKSEAYRALLSQFGPETRVMLDAIYGSAW